MNNVIECHKLVKTYREDSFKVPVLKGIDLVIKQNEMVAITGSSGCGKSTLLHLLGGLDFPTSGTVKVAGKNIHKLSEKNKGILRNRHLGFVYQFHHLMQEFNALENVCMPLLIRGEHPNKAKQKALDLLSKVGLAKRVSHRVSELSGGERQRVAVARALVNEPSCVLADEPTGNLDPATSEHVFELMLSLNQEYQTSFVLVTHDIAIAKRMDRVLKLDTGQITV